MPSAISPSIARVLRDTKISNSEVNGLISEAKRNLTPEVKAELTALLQQHGDKFSNGGKKDLQRFLGTTNVITPPTPQPPPPPPTPKDLADPTVLTKHTTDTTWKPVQDGKLFVDSISYDDVVQGSIGDCYLAAGLSALAHANPDIIKKFLSAVDATQAEQEAISNEGWRISVSDKKGLAVVWVPLADHVFRTAAEARLKTSRCGPKSAQVSGG